MSREYKHYELRPVRSDFSAPGMSGLAMFVDAHGQRDLYMIAFSDSFVAAVGKKLPRGVSKSDPAYVLVQQRPDGTYTIWASYIFERTAVRLWEAEVKPSWLKYRSMEKQNDAHPSTPRKATHRNATDAREAHAEARSQDGTRSARAHPQ